MNSSAGTQSDVSDCFPRHTIASLRQVGVSSLTPLHVKGGGKSVKEVAVENPLSRGGHTHRSPLSALFQKTVARVVVVSFLDIEPH